MRVHKLSPFLWFDNQAEEAVAFYLSVFKEAKPGPVMRCGDAGPGPKGSVLCASFELDGVQIVAMNGGPTFKFNEAISLLIRCQTQQEVDYYWETLGAGGQYLDCGWLKDRYGLCWQVTPERLLELNMDPDPAKAGRVMQAMMTMQKIDIATLEKAAAGG